MPERSWQVGVEAATTSETLTFFSLCDVQVGEAREVSR